MKTTTKDRHLLNEKNEPVFVLVGSSIYKLGLVSSKVTTTDLKDLLASDTDLRILQDKEVKL